jgi:hypothetical protein
LFVEVIVGWIVDVEVEFQYLLADLIDLNGQLGYVVLGPVEALLGNCVVEHSRYNVVQVDQFEVDDLDDVDIFLVLFKVGHAEVVLEYGDDNNECDPESAMQFEAHDAIVVVFGAEGFLDEPSRVGVRKDLIIILVLEVIALVIENGILLLLLLEQLEEVLLLLLIDPDDLTVDVPPQDDSLTVIKPIDRLLVDLHLVEEFLIIVVPGGRIEVLHEGNKLLIDFYFLSERYSFRVAFNLVRGGYRDTVL